MSVITDRASGVLRRFGGTPRFIDSAALTILGSVAGTEYVTHDGTEYALSPATDSVETFADRSGTFVRRALYLTDESGTVPAGEAVQQATKVPPGTFAQLTDKRAKAARMDARHDAPRPVRVAPSHRLKEATGPAAIIERLARRGVTVALTADGQHLDIRSRGGRLDLPDRDYLEAIAALLWAHLAGEPLTCAIGTHKAPVPAVTLLVGGAPACEECIA